MNKRISPRAASLVFLLAASASWAQPVGLNGASIETHFDFPATEDAALVSFDWDASGALHYTVGDPGWGLKLEVYKTATPGDILVYQSDEVYVGSRLTRIGDYVYFNDGGDNDRSVFNYFLYPAATAENVTPLLEYPYDASLWGLATRNADEFFAAGTEESSWAAALFYNTLDASGGFAGTLTKFADIGDSPGPLAFDGAGNLYYVPGYAFSGTAVIYRWTDAEVAAALADPDTAALTPGSNEWAALPAPYDGATGMAADNAGNIYVTATAWGAPSQLVYYSAPSATMFVIGEYDGRLETARHRNNAIHFSCADGVFSLPLPQAITTTDTTIYVDSGETAMFAVEAVGAVGAINYQWYRVSDDKTDTPVGDNLSTYAFIALLEDSGAQFYCEISDDVASATSPIFTLIVQAPMSAATGTTRLLTVLLIAVLGAYYAARRMRLC